MEKNDLKSKTRIKITKNKMFVKTKRERESQPKKVHKEKITNEYENNEKIKEINKVEWTENERMDNEKQVGEIRNSIQQG